MKDTIHLNTAASDLIRHATDVRVNNVIRALVYYETTIFTRKKVGDLQPDPNPLYNQLVHLAMHVGYVADTF